MITKEKKVIPNTKKAKECKILAKQRVTSNFDFYIQSIRKL